MGLLAAFLGCGASRGSTSFRRSFTDPVPSKGRVGDDDDDEDSDDEEDAAAATR